MKTPSIILAAAAALQFLSARADNGWMADSLPSVWQMTPQAVQTLPSDDAWWRSFADPVLDSLIDKAVANNYNVAVAMKRLEMARKAVGEARAGYFPTVSLSGGWTKDRQAGAIEGRGIPSRSSSYFSLGAQMNWEIDVFGRVREGVKAKKAAYDASRADRDAVLVSLCASLASAYVDLRVAQKQLQVAEAHIASQEKIEKITIARFEAELASMLDVTQARIVLYNTRSSVPALKARIKTLSNSISILIGEYPGALAARLSTPAPLPDFRHTVAVGVPADILRRRPDIASAEMELAQYAALAGVAKKAFLPSLSIAGSIGTAAHKAGDLFGKNSLEYSVAPQLSWTLFDGLARNYRAAEARLQLESAVDSYNLTVMNAVEEVDNALVGYDASLQAIDLQKSVVEQSEKSLTLSVDLYKTGLTAFSNVVDGQMNWLESQNALVELEGKALQDLISIYQALGGGWDSIP